MQHGARSWIRRLWALGWGGLLVACGARSSERQAPPQEQEATDMANAQLDEFHSCDVLVGMFQVAAAGSRHVVVFGRDEGFTETTLSLFGPGADGHLRSLRAITEPGIGIRGVDGRLVDGALLFAIESDADTALQWTRASLADALDPSRDLTFAPVWSGGLSDADAARVTVPFDHVWNVVTPLPPPRWLFGPRWVGGAEAGPQVVVSTADGKIALVQPAGAATDAPGESRLVLTMPAEPKATPLPVIEALAPRACMVDQALVVSFLRPGGPVFPFELGAALQSGAPPTPAALIVVEDGKQEHDLSRELDLGPVLEHALAPAPDGSPWLFAIRDADVGTEVMALRRRGPGAWELRGQKRFTRELLRVSALAGEGELWHLVLAEKRGVGWALHELRWKP
jgi:hypothetical protein